MDRVAEMEEDVDWSTHMIRDPMDVEDHPENRLKTYMLHDCQVMIYDYDNHFNYSVDNIFIFKYHDTGDVVYVTCKEEDVPALEKMVRAGARHMELRLYLGL